MLVLFFFSFFLECLNIVYWNKKKILWLFSLLQKKNKLNGMACFISVDMEMYSSSVICYTYRYILDVATKLL